MPRGRSAWTRRTIRAVNYRVALFVRVPGHAQFCLRARSEPEQPKCHSNRRRLYRFRLERRGMVERFASRRRSTRGDCESGDDGGGHL